MADWFCRSAQSFSAKESILVAPLVALIGCAAGGKVSTAEDARRALATHAFEWKDETSLRYGVPAIRNRIAFDAEARRCVVSSRFENEREFRVMIDDEAIIRTTTSHLELTCGSGSYRYVIRSSETIDVYSTFGNPDALATALRI